MALEVVGSEQSAGTIGIATGVIGFGIDSLQITFVSETKEFITGPGTGFRKLSFTVAYKFSAMQVQLKAQTLIYTYGTANFCQGLKLVCANHSEGSWRCSRRTTRRSCCNTHTCINRRNYWNGNCS